MKKCSYCAKEISYHEMFCSDECQQSANRFYELREKFQKPFSVVNGIFVLLIGISIFAYAFIKEAGVWGGAGSLFILSVMYFFLPFPPDVMIEKYKLKKAIFITRVIAGVLFALALVIVILHLVHLL